MSIRKDIPELVKAGVISQETALQIETYYKSQNNESSNKLLIVFGILGAILIGLGIILMIAHNWDELSRTTKTFFAFLPLVTAQIICGYVLLKRFKNTAWREGATTFLVFAIGACISLIGQIYNIPGNLSSFFLVWMLLSLPLIYVMKSSMAALLYVIGITYYGAISYFDYSSFPSYFYALLLLGVLPHYYFLYKNKPKSNFLRFQNWLIPLSITIVLGTFAKSHTQIMYLAYFSLFGLFIIIGNSEFFKNQNLRNNAYKIIGSLGTLTLLFVASYDGFWTDIRRYEFEFQKLIAAPEFWVAIGTTILALGYLYTQQKNKPLNEFPPLSLMFILYIICFFIGIYSSISVLLINLIIFGLSILTILEGTKQENFGILNFGLAIITLWIIFRFLDTDLSFIVRGLLLILIGIGFFASNYWMLKKRKRNA